MFPIFMSLLGTEQLPVVLFNAAIKIVLQILILDSNIVKINILKYFQNIKVIYALLVTLFMRFIDHMKE